MKFFKILLIFPCVLTLVRAERVESEAQQHVSAVSNRDAHAQHPHIKIPALEELTVVRQKDSFVARKYKNYDTTTVTPTLSRNDEF